jgi:tripartite-type tricarboxylate transporter receptor subunit TctC
MHPYSRRTLLAGLAALSVAPRIGFAQGAPLRIVYPYPAGGSADAVARLLADNLHKAYGLSVLVDNKTGAGGAIGAQAVKKAAADGNTLLLAAAAQITLQPHLVADLGYDPFADFVPVAQIMTFDPALAINGQIPATSLDSLAAWIKPAPERGNFGTPGEGTGPHLAGLVFGRTFGLTLSHVPYRGTPAALPDLISGRLPMFLASAPELITNHRRGEIRIIATLGEARSPSLPDVPTFKEGGVDIYAPGWFGLYAPAGTPRDRIAQLGTYMTESMKVPAIRSLAESLGFQVSGIGGAELARVQREQFERWGAVVKTLGMKMRPSQ